MSRVAETSGASPERGGSSRPEASTTTSRSPSLAAGLGLLVLAAAALRVAFALRKGLVLDEFHTGFHATRLVPGGSVQAFLETLTHDNHPPLGFAMVALSKALLGSSEFALRAPALLFGLAEIVLVTLFARRWIGARPALAAGALLAASSLHLDFSTQARMYALHGLCATVTLAATLALWTRERARVAGVALALSLAAAFYTHYYGAHYVVGYALAIAVLAAFDAERRPRLRRFVAPVGAAALLSLPWLASGFRAQVEHALPPGGDDLGLTSLAEAFVHLFFLNVRLGGDALRLAFIGGGGLLLLLGAIGALRGTLDVRTRPLALLCAAGAFCVPVLAFCVARLVPRAGFTWHYVLPSVAPLAVLCALAARDLRPARVAFGLGLGLALLLSILNTASRGTERYPEAVRQIHEGWVAASPGTRQAVISVEWQPPLFPQGQPWDYYAPRAWAEGEAPPRLAMNEEFFTLADPRDLDGIDRVWLLRTSLPNDQRLMQVLRERFDVVSEANFGFGVDVLEWQRRQ